MLKETDGATTATVETAASASPTAQQQWTDIYMRHNFQDTGLYPTEGVLSQSPDIIPAGTQPVSDPSQYITDANWGKDLGTSTTASVPNYIYIRGANLSAAQSTGKFYLYYSPAALLLWPQDPLGDPNKGWANKPLKTSSGSEYVTVTAAAGARLVTPEAFRWIPEPIANDHYCLIGRVVTDQNPNPIPQVGTLTDFGRYISEHPNMTWRNVTTINPANPVSTRVQNYSQGDEGGEVYLFIRCENAPVGSAVEASGQAQGITINIPKTTVTDGQNFVVGTYIDLPAGFTADIAFSWYSQGFPVGAGMEITLDVIMPQNEGDELFDRAASLEDLGLPADFIAERRATVGPTKGIRLGSCGMVAPPAKAPRGGDGRDALASPADGETETAAGMSLNRVAWTETQSSLMGSTSVGKEVSVRSSQDAAGFDSVTVSVAQNPVNDQAADLEADVFFDSGPGIPPEGGEVYFMLTAQNVPVGCGVSFSSGDTEPPVDLPWTTINNPAVFVTGTFVQLPAGFTAPIALKFKTNGQTLPPSVEGRSLTLSAVLQLPDGAHGAQAGGNGASHDGSGDDAAGGPVRGKLLGKATVNL